MAKHATRAGLLTCIRAIMLIEDLTPGEKAVGVAIVSHFNEDTGQCDPSAARLAKLAGVKRHTVFSAIRKLEALGLLSFTTYGGKSHRNSYTPNFDRCSEIARTWGKPSPKGDGSSEVSTVPDGARSTVPDGTHKRIETKRSSYLRPRKGTSSGTAAGQAEEGRPSRQGYLIHAISGQGAQAAEAGAQRRLNSAIQQLRTAEEREAAWLRAMGER